VSARKRGKRGSGKKRRLGEEKGVAAPTSIPRRQGGTEESTEGVSAEEITDSVSYLVDIEACKGGGPSVKRGEKGKGRERKRERHKEIRAGGGGTFSRRENGATIDAKSAVNERTAVAERTRDKKGGA